MFKNYYYLLRNKFLKLNKNKKSRLLKLLKNKFDRYKSIKIEFIR